eukprot:3628435-Pleurochrysis_carterae.AAC.1
MKTSLEYRKGEVDFAPEWRGTVLSSTCICYFGSRRRVLSISEIETESPQGRGSMKRFSEIYLSERSPKFLRRTASELLHCIVLPIRKRKPGTGTEPVPSTGEAGG